MINYTDFYLQAINCSVFHRDDQHQRSSAILTLNVLILCNSLATCIMMSHISWSGQKRAKLKTHWLSLWGGQPFGCLLIDKNKLFNWPEPKMPSLHHAWWKTKQLSITKNMHILPVRSPKVVKAIALSSLQ